MKKFLGIIIVALLIGSCIAILETGETKEEKIMINPEVKSSQPSRDSIRIGIMASDTTFSYDVHEVSYADTSIVVNKSIKTDTLWYGPFQLKDNIVRVSYDTYFNGYLIEEVPGENHDITSKKQLIYLLPHATPIMFSPIVTDWNEENSCNL